MARNDVPASVSMETPKARKAEERRRREIAMEDRPSVSANTPVARREKARASEEARLSTGVRVPFTDIRVGAVPKERWDRMTWEERDEVLRMSQNATETGAAFAVPGMVLRGSAIPKKAKAVADRMLAGRDWASLPRDEKMAIKAKTGIERITGGLDEWLMETPTDPQIRDTFVRRFRDWGKNVPEGHLVPRIEDAPVGAVEGRPVRSYVKDQDGFLDALEGPDHFITLRIKKAESPGLMGEASLAGDEAVVNVTDRLAKIAGEETPAAAKQDLQKFFTHELDHVDQYYAGHPHYLEIPYGNRPTEIEAHIVGERSRLTPAERRMTLMEESHPSIPMYDSPKEFYDSVLRSQRTPVLPLRQDAKGGNTHQDAKGGDAPGGSGEPVPQGGTAPQGGPRIVINPSTFKNKKDAMCVAFNERFRIAMEQYGFEPQSEPTDRQRRFFSDTAYADDEVQLRRTILARILTLDTSVKDPTDEQLREAIAFLQEFKRRERPSNDWEASAIDRLEVLVQTVVNKGKRAAPRPQGGTVRADIGGGATEDDDEENRQQTQEPEETEETEETEEPTDAQEPIEEATPPAETAEPTEPEPAQPATEPAQPSTEPQVATPEPPSPENLEPGQTVSNNGVVMSDEEAQRTADEFRRSLLGDTDNSQDAAITEEPRKPEEASQPPQTQTAQRQAPAQTQQPTQQQTRTQAQAKPTAPSTTVPQPVQTEGQQPAPGARWTTKNQRRMRRYLRALYGKEAAYDAVYGASAKAATVQSPAAKPVRATPRRRA